MLRPESACRTVLFAPARRYLHTGKQKFRVTGASMGVTCDDKDSVERNSESKER